MFVEHHIIQNFSPSCLNRDDTNAPKDCEFGGFRRARVSSQCIKRSIRWEQSFRERLGADVLATRTKDLPSMILKHLPSELHEGLDEDTKTKALERLINVLDLKLKKGKTEYLLFLGENVVRELADVAKDHWEELKDFKNKKPVDKKTTKPVRELLTGGTGAVDVALFGRMVANATDMNVDAACQVAHAISTHEVRMKMDFYTAVDELNTRDETGAGMMGMVEFNSACYYRYSLLNVEQLVKNLRGDRELANRGVLAYIEAATRAIPTGKQNSMAAHNPPSFVYVTLRDRGMPRNLAGAFESPIRPRRDKGLVGGSIEGLARYRSRLNTMYGDDDSRDLVLCLEDDLELHGLGEAPAKVDCLKTLLDGVGANLKRGVPA